MRFRNKMNIGMHPHLGFAALLLLSFLVAVGSAWKMGEAGRNMRSVLTGPLEAERLVSDWSSNIASTITRTTVLVDSRDPRLVSFFAADVAASSKRNTELIQKISGLLDTDEEKALFARIVEDRKAYQSSRDAVFKLKAEGRARDAYKVLEEQYLPVATRYQAMVAEFLQLQRKQFNEEARDAVQVETSGRIELIALAVLTLVVGIGALWRMNTGAPDSHPDSARMGSEADSGNPSLRSEPASGKSGSPERWDEFYDILA